MADVEITIPTKGDSIYDDSPHPEEIITVKDFVDNMTYYLMRPVQDFKDKVTIVFQDVTNRYEFRAIINKSAVMNFMRASYNVSDLKVGSTTSGDIYGGNYTGRRNANRDWDGKDLRTHTPSNKRIIKIIDPADNTIYEGVDKHVIEGNIPIAGQLISVPDIKALLTNCGQKMYTWKSVYVSAWYNVAYENRLGGEWPVWNKPSGNGWLQSGDQWSYMELLEPKESLYTDLPASEELKEDELISIYQLRNMMSNMYVENNQVSAENIYFLTCHNNCHHKCHCARW